MVVAAIISCGNLSAQSPQSTTPRKQINPEELMEKRIQLLQDKLALDEATAAKFTPLYKEYMKEMRACHFNRGEFKRDTNMSDSEREKCIERGLECKQKMLDTQEKYYKQFKGILNARQLEILFSRSKDFHRNGKCAQKRHKHNFTNCNDYGQYHHQEHCNN